MSFSAVFRSFDANPLSRSKIHVDLELRYQFFGFGDGSAICDHGSRPIKVHMQDEMYDYIT